MKSCVITLVVVCLAILASASAGRAVEAQTTVPTIRTAHPTPTSPIYVNETFRLRFSMRRLSGDYGHGGISVSFPDFTQSNTYGTTATQYDSAQGAVSTQSYTGGTSRVTYRSRGHSPINKADGSITTAQYLLVESDDTDWPENQARTLDLSVTPKRAGIYTIYYRYWLCADGYQNCARSPATNRIDPQQGWSVGAWTVEVANRRPSVSAVAPLSSLLLTPGDTQTFTARATDPDENISQVEWFVDGRSEAGESLTPTGSVTRSFTYTFPSEGGYRVEAEFTDLEGASDRVRWSVNTGIDYDVTITSNPLGRTVTVDQVDRTTPYSAVWRAGEFHTLDVPSPQRVSGVNDRYVFSHWRHGGSRRQTVQPAGDTTYTANFTLQHFLTTRTDPGGGGIPGGGRWYDHGSTARVGPAPNMEGYEFSHWEMDGQTIGTDPAGVSVTVNASTRVQAVYTAVVAPVQPVSSAPQNVFVTRGPNPRDARVFWDAVETAEYYRIGWALSSDYDDVDDLTEGSLDALTFVEIANRGQATYTVSDLLPGQEYYFVVGSKDDPDGEVHWAAEWAPLTLAEAEGYMPLFDEGVAEITWDRLDGPAYLRIGWVSPADYEAEAQTGITPQESLRFVDVLNLGQTSHTIGGLKPGAQYYYVVAGLDARHGQMPWPLPFDGVSAQSGWKTVSFAPNVGDGCTDRMMSRFSLAPEFPEEIEPYLCRAPDVVWTNLCQRYPFPLDGLCLDSAPDQNQENYWIFVPVSYTDPDEIVKGLHGREFNELEEWDNRINAYKKLILELAVQKALRDRNHEDPYFNFYETGGEAARTTDQVVNLVTDYYDLAALGTDAAQQTLSAHIDHLLHNPGLELSLKFGGHAFDVAMAAAVNRTIDIEAARKNVELLAQLPMDSAWDVAIVQARADLDQMTSENDLENWAQALQENIDEITRTVLTLAARYTAVVAIHAAGVKLTIATAPISLTVGLAVTTTVAVFYETDEFWDDLTLATAAAQAYWHTQRNLNVDGSTATHAGLLEYEKFTFYQHLHEAATNWVAEIGWIGNLGETTPSGASFTILDRRDLALDDILGSTWEPSRDLKRSMGLSRPRGIWSDGQTMWVMDAYRSVPVRAVNMANAQRNRHLDFYNPVPPNAQNHGFKSFEDFFSYDSTTLFTFRGILNQRVQSSGLHAYDAPPPLNDDDTELFVVPLAPQNKNVSGIWSDGTTAWIANTGEGRLHRGKIFAYDLANKRHDPSKDLNGLRAAGNDAPTGIWADGDTMWVVDSDDDRVYAYNMRTGRRDITGEFGLVNVPTVVSNTDPRSIWGEEGVLWILDAASEKIFAYRLPERTAIVETLPVGRQFAADLGRLQFAGNEHAEGIWSDGATMWVSDHVTDHIYAYRLSDGSRVSHLELTSNTLKAAGNDGAKGITSDGRIIWVADHQDDHIYAYRLENGARITAEEFASSVLKAAGNEDATGIWYDSQTDTMWVADHHDNAVYGYDRETKSLVRTIDTLRQAGNQYAEGIWSDGTTMWVADRDDDHIYAYRLSDGARVAEAEINTPGTAGNDDMRGIWSDGTTIWVADQDHAWIYAYHMPLAEQPGRMDVAWGRLEIDPPALPSEGGDVTVRVFTHEPSDPDHVAEPPGIYAVIPAEIAIAGATNRWDGDVGPCSTPTVAREDHTEYCWQATFQGVPANARRDTVVNGNVTSGALVYEVRVESDRITGTAPTGSFSVAGLSPFTEDRELLEAIYDATGGVDWYSQTYAQRNTDEDWLTHRPIGDWHGVTVNPNGRVTRLELTENYLLGDLPDEVGDLEYLEILDLASNNMVKLGRERVDWTGVSGRMPTALGRLARLTRLDLSVNNLSGSIPPELGNLQRVVELKLDDNRLSGQIPAALGNLTSLQSLDLSENRLTGQIPAELALLTSLTELRLSGNQFTGCVPAPLLNVPDNDLAELDLPECEDDTGTVADIVHLPSQDFDGLTNAGNDDPSGIWSDGATMWVADVRDEKIYAYGLDSRARVAGQDFNTLDGAGNYYPRGIWSDRTTMWVVDGSDDKLYAYDMRTRARVGARDFETLSAAGNDNPRGIWSDGTTMWVADSSDDKLYAYDMRTKNRVADRDFDTLELAGNDNSRGIWSDGTTMWVADATDEKLYAYDMGTTLRVPSRDYDALGDAGNIDPEGIWSDGTTMWVADETTRKIYAYGAAVEEPPDLLPLGNPTGLTASPGAQSGEVVLRWTPAANATVHWVYLMKEDGTDARYWPQAQAGDAATLTVTGLDVGATYWFLVIAGQEQADGTPLWSGWSNWAEAAVEGIDGLPPEPPDDTSTDSVSDRAILVTLYNATNGSNWRYNANWLTDAPLGEWDGVTTDDEGRVVRLTLLANRLTGMLPRELGDLSESSYLDLGYNQLTGLIPSELGDLSELSYLGLGYNQLTGPIPSELGDLSELSYLDLEYNQLTGQIPAELGGLTNLETLRLFSNHLSGEIPATLGNLPNLRRLDLTSNGLSGEIPAALGNLSNLNRLSLGSNQLTGQIPSTLANLTNLERLRIDSNQLSGEIPAQLGSLANLTLLYLSSNDFTGCIPAALRDIADNDFDELDLPFCGDPVVDLASEREALTSLYNATNGANWTNNANWLTDAPLGEWHGVTTDGDGQVVRIDLQENGLTGQLPDGLGNLSNLAELRLRNNQLTGAIPSQLGRLANLKVLYLGRNQLTGPIPSELGDLSSLTQLALYNNDLTGEVPDSLGRLSNLRQLDLGGNELVGALPSWLGNLSNLTYLSLWGNGFTGSIPSNLGSLSGLRTLDIRENQLSGSIPSQLGSLSNLRILWLYKNQLTGAVPPVLGNLTSLEQLRLNDNQLTGLIPASLGHLSQLTHLELANNQFSGGIPTALGDLSSLVNLGLDRNRLTGSIPTQLGSLSNLHGLWLHGNLLNGAIPSALGDLSKLTRLSLADNQLTGEIPPELGNLINLTLLYLLGNQLTGPIPEELGNLVNLEQLYLYQNQLNGEIPSSLSNLSKLQRLSLRDNQLSGRIPSWLVNLTDLDLLRLEGNELTGTIPAGLGNLSKLRLLHLGRNQLSGSIPPLLGNLSNLERLHLYQNELTGQIPASLGNLAKLEELYLNNNRLTGSVPSSLVNLRNLVKLYIAANDFTGCIPDPLFDVSENDLGDLELPSC